MLLANWREQHMMEKTLTPAPQTLSLVGKLSSAGRDHDGIELKWSGKEALVVTLGTSTVGIALSSQAWRDRHGTSAYVKVDGNLVTIANESGHPRITLLAEDEALRSQIISFCKDKVGLSVR